MISANLLQTFAHLLHLLIQLYILIIIARTFISWMGSIPPIPIVTILYRLTNPIFRFVHWRMPFFIIGNIDLTPMVIIFALYFIDNLLTELILNFARSLH